MKTLVVALVGMVFLAGTSSLVVAQAPPAEKKAPAKAETPKAEKKAETPKTEKKAEAAKKPAVKTVSGTVKTVGADLIVVMVVSMGKDKGKDQAKSSPTPVEYAVIINDKTKFRKASKDVTLADVKVGDRVNVRYIPAELKNIGLSVTVYVKPSAKTDDAAKKPDAPVVPAKKDDAAKKPDAPVVPAKK